VTAFFFELGCVSSYLAGERIERALGDVEWVPTVAAALGRDGQRSHLVRAHAERRAMELKLPLVWPDRFPARAPRVLRAAAYAAEIGRGSRFALAANRLAFCGGFDLEDPEILGEAAAAAGIPLERCLTAARDRNRDGVLHATSRGLRDQGVAGLPAIRVGRRWFEGEGGVAGAIALLRAEVPHRGLSAPPTQALPT